MPGTRWYLLSNALVSEMLLSKMYAAVKDAAKQASSETLDEKKGQATTATMKGLDFGKLAAGTTVGHGRVFGLRSDVDTDNGDSMNEDNLDGFVTKLLGSDGNF